MKELLTVWILSIALIGFGQNSDVENKVSAISSLMRDYPDSAISLSEKLVEQAKASTDEYGIVQANFLLGYIYDEYKSDFAKSIIYYLEGIRFASDASYQNAVTNEISLRKNCGIIYRKFKAFDLATEQYQAALKLATSIGAESQILSISYNLAGVYSDMNQLDQAIQILEAQSSMLSPDANKYFNVNNRLGQLYVDNHQYDQAVALARTLLQSGNPTHQELVDSYQILARSAVAQNQVEEGLALFENALKLTNQIPEGYDRSKAKFECHLDLGLIYKQKEKFLLAETAFQSALNELPNLDQKPTFHKVYKELATVYFLQQKFQLAKKHEDLYSNTLNEYLLVQEEIQNKNQMYNMDLITKRYYDQVEKQERIATILFYAKIISFGLLILLLTVIGFNRFEKLQLKKELSRELTQRKWVS